MNDSLHLSDLDSLVSTPKKGSRDLETAEMMQQREIEEDEFDADLIATNYQINEILSDVNFLCAKAHAYAKNSGVADDKFEQKVSTPKPLKIPKRSALLQEDRSSSYFSSTPKKQIRGI